MEIVLFQFPTEFHPLHQLRIPHRKRTEGCVEQVNVHKRYIYLRINKYDGINIEIEYFYNQLIYTTDDLDIPFFAENLSILFFVITF